MVGMGSNVTWDVLHYVSTRRVPEMTAVVQLTTVDTIPMADASKYCHRIVKYCDHFV